MKSTPIIFVQFNRIKTWIFVITSRIVFCSGIGLLISFSIHNLIFPPPLVKVIFDFAVIILIWVLFLLILSGIKGWKTIFTNLCFTDDGIKIENKWVGVVDIGWKEIDRVIYTKTINHFKIYSPILEEPLIMANYGGPATLASFNIATALIKHKVKDRIIVKWLSI